MTLRQIRHAGRSFALASCIALSSSIASAQTEAEVAGARAAATEGAKAYKEQRWADAIDLFRRAESLVHAPPHLLYQARANVQLGHLVTARELYNKVIRDQLADNAPPAFKQAQADAQTEIQEVEPRLAKLTILVSAPEGVTPKVTLDGAELAGALLGVPSPADPGEHVVEAVAEGYLVASQKTTLAEGGSGQIALRLQPDPNYQAPVEAVAAPAQGEPAPTEPAAAPDAGVQADSSSLATPAYIALGVGAVGLIGGVVFTLQSVNKRGEADDKEAECRRNGVGGTCNEPDPLIGQIKTLDDEAGTAQTISYVGYGLGVLGVAAGVTLLVLDSGPTVPASAVTVTPWVGYRSLGVTGRF